ncbi:MAG: GDSL-type esterase/lipase family protein [Massilia sp.]
MKPSLYSLLLLALAVPASAGQAPAPLRFSFAGPAPDMQAVACDHGAGVRAYDAGRGWGFVARTGAQPPRPVHVAGIRCTGKAAVIDEPAFDGDNHFGMAFRVKAPPGTYDIRVRATAGADDATVSVSGMQTSRLLKPGNWDAAGLLPNRTLMRVDGHEWRYRYVNGQEFIDIEVEPNRTGTPVGIEALEIVPVALEARPPGALPAVFTLGDSTVKSYTFEEAPMSGWGQVFGKLFDPARVRVVNYANGGRSFRNAYAEGRFNDLLLAGHPGDVVLVQFGHNDESEDETARWGRGATEATYEGMIRNVYLPAIRARGMSAVLVTPMSRVNGMQPPDTPYENSFRKRRFPDVMRRVALDTGVPLVDLNARSVEYYNEAGAPAVTAMIMSIEAGETPGKTNDGSYANGHPANKIDGTHFKEAMSKQYARMVVTELARLAQGDPVAARVAGTLRADVRAAIAAGDWSAIYPEIAADIRSGADAYYRNQIEKLIQLGALHEDAQGNVHPEAPMDTREFAAALGRLLRLPEGAPAGFPDGPLRREVMGAIVDDAYHLRFASKPRYMTDYNGRTVVPGSPGYDPNLDAHTQGAHGAMYYPLVDWAQLEDGAAVTPALAARVEDAYRLGLIRSETGIARGRMVDGRRLEPQTVVSRAKAAKTLYFMWVLAQPPQVENDRLAPPAQDYQRPGVAYNMPVFAPALKARMRYPLAWSPQVADLPAWRDRGRAAVWQATLQERDDTPFAPEVIAEQDRGNYVARQVVFNVTAPSRVRALLLVPKSAGTHPAVLMLHDHGGKFDIGKEKMIEPFGTADAARHASAQAWADKHFSGRWPGDALAARGYVVLCADAVGWGDRGPLTGEAQQALASNFFNLGSSLAGNMALEDVRAAQFLASLPEVDGKHVAALGFSMGAFRAWQVAALSDAISAVIASNWMATADGLMVPGSSTLRGSSSFQMMHPGLLRWLDYPDVASLAAPKPALFFAGATDKLFPAASVREAYAKMARVWRAWNAADSFEAIVRPGGHEFPREVQDYAYDWLDRQFGRIGLHAANRAR